MSVPSNFCQRYLYAIVRCGEPLTLDKQAGGEEALRNIPYQGVGAIIGDLLPNKSAATTDNVLHHERIVEQLMEHFTLLPVRFGTTLADDRQVESLLVARYPLFQRNLTRVANRIELSLKILWAGEQTQREIEGSNRLVEDARAAMITVGPGKDYLMKRLQALAVTGEMRRRATDLAEPIHRLLLTGAAEGTCALLASRDLVMSAHYLVEREQVSTFRHALARLESERRDLHFLSSGPWPPYNFIDSELKFGRRAM